MPKKSIIIHILYLLVLNALSLTSIGQDNQFSVFDAKRDGNSAWQAYSDNDLALYNHISNKAKSCLNQRKKIIESLVSKEDWLSYTQELREDLFLRIEQFRKTPLNTGITGIIKKEGYSIEKIVFESHPGFYVTGCLFLPNTDKVPFPCIIYCSGHSILAFRNNVYQNVILNLVKKGFAVYAFDPIGQGERLQYLDIHKNQSIIGAPTSEHSYAGAQNLLLGESLTSYIIWDGVRAVDYLFSRPDIDSSRIGITGRSGGGTQSALIAAYDKRICAAAPECYITNYQRLFESIGPQDAEQNPYQGIKKGFDHADILHLIAPRPALIVTTTNDFFSIQGARETFKEAQKSYKFFSKTENIGMVESYGIHESTLENREAVYAFFQKHLNNKGDYKEEEIELLNVEDLKVTPIGQVSSSYESKTTFDLIQNLTDSLIKERQINTPESVLKNSRFIIGKARELSGFESSRSIKSVVYAGNIEKDKYKIEKYFIQGEDFDYPIPFVLIKPLSNQKRPLLFYLNSAGKEILLKNNEDIEQYLDKGYTILVPDLVGSGELSNTSFIGDSYIQDYSYNILFGANLVGTSVAGMQASDLEVIFKHTLTRDDIDTKNITSVISGEICSSYLHFAIFNKYINKTILVNPLISYENIIRTRLYSSKYVWNAVPGAFQYYDLPYLLALLTPSELIIINPVDGKGEVDNSNLFDQQYSFLKEAYRLREAEKNLEVTILNEKEVKNCILSHL